MDAVHIEAIVDLNGGWGEDILDGYVKHFKERAPERFVHFGGVDWSRWPEGELGHQPYSARRFFLRYADHILFATDTDARLETYQRHYRFLESDDESFKYNFSDPPWQGRWYVYGLYLPDEVLR